MPSKQTKRNKRIRRRKALKGNTIVSVLSNQPATPTFALTMRYISVTNTYAPIFPTCLMNSIVVCAGSHLVYPIIFSARLRKISFEIVSNASASVASVSMGWAASMGPQRQLVVSGTPEHPGTFKGRPPANTDVGEWYNRNSPTALTNDPIFFFTTDSHLGMLVVDVTFDFVLDNGGTNMPAFTTTAAGTVGKLYYSSLDNTSSGGAWNTSPVFQPTGSIVTIV